MRDLARDSAAGRCGYLRCRAGRAPVLELRSRRRMVRVPQARKAVAADKLVLRAALLLQLVELRMVHHSLNGVRDPNAQRSLVVQLA